MQENMEFHVCVHLNRCQLFCGLMGAYSGIFGGKRSKKILTLVSQIAGSKPVMDMLWMIYQNHINNQSTYTDADKNGTLRGYAYLGQAIGTLLLLISKQKTVEVIGSTAYHLCIQLFVVTPFAVGSTVALRAWFEYGDAFNLADTAAFTACFGLAYVLMCGSEYLWRFLLCDRKYVNVITDPTHLADTLPGRIASLPGRPPGLDASAADDFANMLRFPAEFYSAQVSFVQRLGLADPAAVALSGTTRIYRQLEADLLSAPVMTDADRRNFQQILLWASAFPRPIVAVDGVGALTEPAIKDIVLGQPIEDDESAPRAQPIEQSDLFFVLWCARTLMLRYAYYQVRLKRDGQAGVRFAYSFSTDPVRWFLFALSARVQLGDSVPIVLGRSEAPFYVAVRSMMQTLRDMEREYSLSPDTVPNEADFLAASRRVDEDGEMLQRSSATAARSNAGVGVHAGAGAEDDSGSDVDLLGAHGRLDDESAPSASVPELRGAGAPASDGDDGQRGIELASLFSPTTRASAGAGAASTGADSAAAVPDVGFSLVSWANTGAPTAARAASASASAVLPGASVGAAPASGFPFMQGPAGATAVRMGLPVAGMFSPGAGARAAAAPDASATADPFAHLGAGMFGEMTAEGGATDDGRPADVAVEIPSTHRGEADEASVHGHSG